MFAFICVLVVAIGSLVFLLTGHITTFEYMMVCGVGLMLQMGYYHFFKYA